MNLIEIAVANVLFKWAYTINKAIENEYGNISQIPGEKHVHEPMLLAIGDAIVVELSYSGMGAWIAEFGSGSWMEKSYAENPQLREYESSEYWNKHRTGYSIRGREAGVYKDIDGNTHVSSGKMKGLNLENDGYAKAFQPMRIIKEQVALFMPEILADIENTIGEEILKMLAVDIQVYV